MLSEEVKQYKPDYKREDFSPEQISIIERSFAVFNDIAKNRDDVIKAHKDCFVYNLINHPEYSVDKMETILESEINLFNYMSACKNSNYTDLNLFKKISDDKINACNLPNDYIKETVKNNDDINLDLFL
jgi:hypothetical protein